MSEREEVQFCAVCFVDVRTGHLFIFVCVLFQEENIDVIVVGDGIFLSRCLIVALPCRR